MDIPSGIGAVIIKDPSIIDAEMRSFYIYLLSWEKILNSIFYGINKEKENDYELLNELSREDRRYFEKNYLNKSDKRLNSLKSMFKLNQNLKDVIENKIIINSNYDFCFLIFVKIMYDQEAEKAILRADLKKSKDIIQYYVQKSKKVKDGQCGFLQCFNDDGSVKTEMVYYLRNLLYAQYKQQSNEYPMFKSIDIDDYVSNLISDDMLKEADLLRQKQGELNDAKKEQEKKERQTQKEILEQKKKENEMKMALEMKNNKQEKVFTHDEILLSKVVSISTWSLRKNILDTVSLEELQKILNSVENLSNSDIDKFIEEYKSRLLDRRMNYVFKILSKSDLKKLKNAIKGKNSIIINSIKNLLMSEEYEEYSEEQINNCVKGILDDKLLNKSNLMNNFVIFSSDSLVNEEQQLVEDSRVDVDKNGVIKGYYYHLLTLQSLDLNEIRTNKESAFHVLKDSDRRDFIIDKLKGYRFGARKAKVALFVLSVNKENQEKLNEIYHTNVNSNIFLVFGLGHVNVEREDDIFKRVIKYASLNKERLLHIYDIFANPFTDETLVEAKKLINDGILTINDMFNSDPVNVNKCTILKKENE